MFRPTRRYNKNPARRKVPGVGAENRIGTRTPVVIGSANPLTAPNVIVEVQFDEPCFYTGILPAWTGPAGQTVVSVTVIDALNIRVTFSATLTTADEITIPFEDPSVRNQSGGYVRNASVVLAAP